MNPILIAFLTGLTSGGLSCLAVQGGLLASSLSSQLELDLQSQAVSADRKKKSSGKIPLSNRLHLARPIVLFLLAKILAYTLLGFLLGAAGSVFQLNTVSRGILQIAVGIFMLGTALQMLNIHPIFRIFVIEPPAFVRRMIRKYSRGNDYALTPLFLGALTVLIPCGITQAMMALAVGTGSATTGAAILFAFTVGTSPLFFTVAYLTTRLGSIFEKYFTRFVAAIVLILGVVAVSTGLTLMGSPLAPSNFLLRNSASQSASQPVENKAATPGVYQVVVNANDDGYSPEILQAPANQPVQLVIQTKDTHSCTRSFSIPELDMNELLPATGSVSFNIPPQVTGKVINFSCSMGMYSGVIRFN